MKALLLSIGLTTVSLAAQEVAVSLADGTLARGRLTKVEDPGGITLAGTADTRVLPRAGVLGVHGPAPRLEGASVVVHRQDGGRWAGDLRGGDASGESLLVGSRSLGEVSESVDRIRAILFRRQAGEISVEDLVLPEQTKNDEALFRRARRGVDRILGAIERFTPTSVYFQVEGEAEPREFPYSALVGIAIRGASAGSTPAGDLVITRAGDVVRCRVLGLDQDALRLSLGEDRTLRLPVAELSSWTLLEPGRRFLSDLEAQAVEEASYFEPAGRPLFPVQRDHTVTGGFLASGGLAFGKGLGVHSRSRLRFVVPPGVRWFQALVGVDDEILTAAPGLRGDVDVRVRLGDKVLRTQEGLRGGMPPVHLGNLAVRPGDVLALEVEFGKGLDLADRVGWYQAVFLP
ncbi:MAG: NPCBM/NEW2 domain-containing protein [Planctomycetes bacterium]|nr:NPCBM/NEW2 domain-containing protein [Planctomycetota bacterium]